MPEPSPRGIIIGVAQTLVAEEQAEALQLLSEFIGAFRRSGDRDQIRDVLEMLPVPVIAELVVVCVVIAAAQEPRRGKPARH